jgi:cytochrome c oxidase cbb3-type subunit 2
MNSLTNILPGIFACVLSSWMGLVAIPYFQLGALQPQVNQDLGEVYPVDAPKAGEQVYIANGCINCHSQQIRPGHAGGDIARGWGPRQTVARDYMYDHPLLTGTVRMGPDLSNIGTRANEQYLYRSLYSPASDVPDSIMPAFDFLFKKVKISGERAADALDLPEKSKVEEGYQIIPKPEAQQLVAYLMSLQRSHPLPEAVQEVKEEEKKGSTQEAGASPATKVK